jgi:hypothetical protein
MGSAIVSPESAQLDQLLGVEVAPWIGSAPNGEAFHVANSLVRNLDKAEKDRFGINKSAVDAIAAASVHAGIDGGMSDASGIGNAIAAGADEIVYIINKDSSESDDLISVLAFFAGFTHFEAYPKELYPIFSSPNVTVAQENIKKFDTLDVGNSSLLSYISTGTLSGVTANNTYFGISAGRTITIHVIAVAGKLTMGQFEDYMNYATFTQEIMMVLLSNREYVSQKLLPFFSPASLATSGDQKAKQEHAVMV